MSISAVFQGVRGVLKLSTNCPQIVTAWEGSTELEIVNQKKE